MAAAAHVVQILLVWILNHCIWLADAASLDFSMDLFAGETGYYKVGGYNGVSPTLTFELNTEYYLVQKHISNWMHPIGLAFQPDGAHDVMYPGADGAPEVADGTNTTGYEYVYQIKYPGTTSWEDKTLDDYEPLFFYPLGDWAKYEFRIKVKITDASFASNIVYFCHIHNKMSGKIEITGGTGPSVTNLYTPTLDSAFDQGCGTHAAEAYQDQCSGQVFLCGDTSSDFAKCMIAIDCKMYKDMMANYVEPDSVTTFMHQMIPHHQNAVNMARILLKKTPPSYVGGDGSLSVDIAESEAGEYDGFQDMLMDMVNSQNYQISEMRKWLLENGKDESSTCSRRLAPAAKVAPGVPAGLKRMQVTAPRARQLKVRRAPVRSSERKLVANSNNIFKFQLDFFQGETGYYKVEGYEGIQPELTIELDTEYWLDQTHVTNWMHPIGLAFQADGAHDVLYPGGNGAPEIADGVGTTGYEYVYYIKRPDSSDFEAATLDDYEPLFFLPLAEWAKYEFKIKLRVTSASVASNIVYFCHIHNKMSGKIVINGGTGPVVDDLYSPRVVSEFDQRCGTDLSADYEITDKHCPELKFICGATGTSFSQCMGAIDCKMNYEMQVMNIDANPVATFMYQMIPHHVNAVNMARIMLKKTGTYGDNSLAGVAGVRESEAGEHDGLQDMWLAMVNTQNYQISEMRKWLLENGFQLHPNNHCNHSTYEPTTGEQATTGEPDASTASMGAPSTALMAFIAWTMPLTLSWTC